MTEQAVTKQVEFGRALADLVTSYHDTSWEELEYELELMLVNVRNMSTESTGKNSG